MLRNQLYKCTFNEYICISFTLYISALEKKTLNNEDMNAFFPCGILAKYYLTLFSFSLFFHYVVDIQVRLYCTALALVRIFLAERKKKVIYFRII